MLGMGEEKYVTFMTLSLSCIPSDGISSIYVPKTEKEGNFVSESGG